MRYLALLLLLTACGESFPLIHPVEVQVPIVTRCEIELPKKPECLFCQISPDAPLRQAVEAALIDLEQQKAYSIELEAAVSACNDTKQAF